MPSSPTDTFAIIESVIRQGDALAAVTSLDGMMRDSYWKQKNLSAAIALGRAAAQHALTSAARIEPNEPEVAEQLRGKAFAICYNIASFAWSGWGEEGITVTASDEMVGLDAARANLRVAGELKKGDVQFCRAHWMLGAQQLAARDFPSAIESFASSQRHARAADKRGEELLAVAFSRLAQFLQNASPDSQQQLATSIEELQKVEDGAFFAGQVTKAQKVFSGKTSTV